MGNSTMVSNLWYPSDIALPIAIASPHTVILPTFASTCTAEKMLPDTVLTAAPI